MPIEVGPDTPREFTVQEKQPNTGNAKSLWKTLMLPKRTVSEYPRLGRLVRLEGPHDPNRPNMEAAP